MTEIDVTDIIEGFSEDKVLVAFLRALRACEYVYREEPDGTFVVFDGSDIVTQADLEDDALLHQRFQEELKLMAVDQMKADLETKGFLKRAGIDADGNVVYDPNYPLHD
jgi:hypothetical protein